MGGVNVRGRIFIHSLPQFTLLNTGGVPGCPSAIDEDDEGFRLLKIHDVDDAHRNLRSRRLSICTKGPFVDLYSLRDIPFNDLLRPPATLTQTEKTCFYHIYFSLLGFICYQSVLVVLLSVCGHEKIKKKCLDKADFCIKVVSQGHLLF